MTEQIKYILQDSKVTVLFTWEQQMLAQVNNLSITPQLWCNIRRLTNNILGFSWNKLQKSMKANGYDLHILLLLS